MQHFGAIKSDGHLPVSIKVRIGSGCFHREHSPEAYRLIDNYIAQADLSELHYEIEEHETGPEVLVYLAVTAAGLGFAKSLVELITAIIKSRSEGIKRGDRRSDPVEIIVRGHSKEGEYFEEKILRIPSDHVVSAREIKSALTKQTRHLPKKKTRKRK